MKKQLFNDIISSGIVMLDGATGTELIKASMPSGVCPEKWILENPQHIFELQKKYVQAGSKIIYAPSFGANRMKLELFGLQDEIFSINREIAELSKKAAGDEALVFGDIAPTGHFVEPGGDLSFNEAKTIYKEQVEALLAADVDGFVVETMMDVQEARAAVLAIKEACDLPVFVSLTFEKGKFTLAGNHPISALLTMQALKVDAFGCNCSSGPEEMLEIITMLKPYAKIPLLAKPNAGLPQLQGEQTVFSMSAKEFAVKTAALIDAGASIVGGCCGAGIEHIKELQKELTQKKAPEVKAEIANAISSARSFREISANASFTVVGERINPSGKKAFQAELRENKFALLQKYADEQEAAGATVLEVNVGLSGIDEAAVMREAVSLLSINSKLPLCIDSTDPAAVEAGLSIYPGRALYNSISAEKERLTEVLPIAAKYGAMLVLLPLTDEGIPDTVEGRIEALKTILSEVKKYGYSEADVCVDGLVMTASTNVESVAVCLEFLAWCNSQGLNTICGLSNVSFGLPRRDLVNLAFLGMALGKGLNMAIVNPLQQEIMDMIRAGDALNGKDPGLLEYCQFYAGEKQKGNSPAKTDLSAEAAVYEALLKGNKANIVQLIEKASQAGFPVEKIADQILIPAITEVGEKYEKKEYFLPQLMMSADAMQAAMDYLEPLLSKQQSSEQKMGKIILATVKGDIHDIGKNIVAVMFKNYGYEVYDLGKDISADEILQCAEKNKVKLIGLSALMTTTMGEMEKVIEKAKEKNMIELKFLVGGAVVDEQFASKIGAYYAKDAMEAVKIARELVASG